MKDLHSQVLEQMLQGEMYAHLGYEKNYIAGDNTGNSRNGNFPKTIQTEHGDSTTIQIPRDRKGEFDPIIASKHKSRGLSLEKHVISQYAKRGSVLGIGDELHSIYEINLSGSSISIITNKVT